MSDKKRKKSILKDEHLVVKNKKFKKSDIVAFGVCLIAALVIWIYATNSEINKEKELESLKEELAVTQNA